MIDSKASYRHYLERDRAALNRQQDKRPKLFGDEIWKFEILLRKVEYDINCRRGVSALLIGKYHKFRFHRLSVKLGFTVPPNVFREWLSIPHYGTIVVHDSVRAGVNCRLQEGVTIGATGGRHEAAVIGENCYFGSGAKVIGAVTIADDVAIGAGAVVTHDITESGTTWGGVPAKKISDKNSHCLLCSALFS